MDLAACLDRFFHLTERSTDVRTEFKGALLIFLSMSYIIVVNPLMMSSAGMDASATFTATILMTIFGCLVMGLYANFPVAQAPAMGINAFFVYTVVLTMGYQWDTALAAVVISGALFLLVSVSGVRKRVLDSIPVGLRCGISAGIGFFIALVGLINAGILVGGSGTLVSLGDLSDVRVLLGLFSIGLTVFLYSRRVHGAILIGMLVTALLAIALGTTEVPDSIFAAPTMPDFGAFLGGFGPEILDVKFLMVVVSFAFVEFFDGSGTLMAVGKRAGIMDVGGNVVLDRAMNADAACASISGVVGCTPTSAYAESAVGIEAGSRTGLTAVFVAMFFAVSLLIGPIFQMVDIVCTAGAMFIVGVAMIAELRGMDWDDVPLTAAVMLTIMMMLMSYSITNGIAFGIIIYCVSMIGARRRSELNPIMYAMAAISVLYYVMTSVCL